MESANAAPAQWRKCTTCKKPIAFGQKYWVCSVSTCNRARTGLVFCTVSCFDAHVPVMNHRDAGAFERKAPTIAEWRREQEEAAARSIPAASVTEPKPSPAPAAQRHAPAPPARPEADDPMASEVLVVVSKVKEYIRSRSGMNTSDAVMRALSKHVRAFLEDAIRRAAQDERKTVLDRDVR